MTPRIKIQEKALFVNKMKGNAAGERQLQKVPIEIVLHPVRMEVPFIERT